MNNNSWFKQKDASNFQILLLFMAILVDTALYLPSSELIKNKEPRIDQGAIPFLMLKRHCYEIPYSRNQLAEIWSDKNGKKRKEIQNKLDQEIIDEDLGSIAGPLITFYGLDSTTLCIDFKYAIDPLSVPSKNRQL